HPPDAVLRAYADLINYIFLLLRITSRTDELSDECLFDLADAMHNIGGLISDYGAWTDDAKYRERYLRRFDEKWNGRNINLEAYVESRLKEYLKPGSD
ncbi:MAG TPA: hypothetical protein VHR72_08205, partial [Gemmataceae bacterium]|nr:hypothetical protein [Gemmataceae bacterium]